MVRSAPVDPPGAQQPDDSVRPGDVLAGKYRIERVLGRGGMGVVVSAVHLRLDERVAIKFLLPAATESPEAVARFEREARAAVKIRSEHVARVIDVGTLETGAPYIVMEHLQGSDLATVVRQRRKLPVEDAVEYVLQACEAIAEAHAMGIVHRDLKPNNLFLTQRADGSPVVKVLDFGISKLLPGASTSEPQASMTSTDSLLGSPIYMSPEQMTNPRGVDARTDVWALGATLFKLVTGKAPFDGDSIPQICGMIMMGTPPLSLRSLAPDAPEALEAVVVRCLQRQPADRFADVGELAAALEELAPDRALFSVERIRRVLEAGAAGVGGGSLPPAPASSPSASSRKSTSAPRVSLSSVSSPPAAGSATGPDAAVGPPSVGAKTMAAWTNTSNGRGGGSRRLAIVAGAAAVLAVGVALGVLLRGGPGDGATAAEGATAAPPAAATVDPTPPTPVVSTAPTPSTEPSSAPSAAASAATKPTAAARSAPPARDKLDAKPAKEPAAEPPVPTPNQAPKKKPSGELFDERM